MGNTANVAAATNMYGSKLETSFIVIGVVVVNGWNIIRYFQI